MQPRTLPGGNSRCKTIEHMVCQFISRKVKRIFWRETTHCSAGIASDLSGTGSDSLVPLPDYSPKSPKKEARRPPCQATCRVPRDIRCLPTVATSESGPSTSPNQVAAAESARLSPTEAPHEAVKGQQQQTVRPAMPTNPALQRCDTSFTRLLKLHLAPNTRVCPLTSPPDSSPFAPAERIILA